MAAKTYYRNGPAFDHGHGRATERVEHTTALVHRPSSSGSSSISSVSRPRSRHSRRPPFRGRRSRSLIYNRYADRDFREMARHHHRGRDEDERSIAPELLGALAGGVAGHKADAGKLGTALSAIVGAAGARAIEKVVQHHHHEGSDDEGRRGRHGSRHRSHFHHDEHEHKAHYHSRSKSRGSHSRHRDIYDFPSRRRRRRHSDNIGPMFSLSESLRRRLGSSSSFYTGSLRHARSLNNLLSILGGSGRLDRLDRRRERPHLVSRSRNRGRRNSFSSVSSADSYDY